MPRKRIPFGPLLPDQPPNGQCVLASNVYPIANGYGAVPSFLPITPALAGINGGAAFVSSTGLTAFLAGTPAALWRYAGAAWVQQLAEPALTRWRFAQFGDLAIGVNGGAPVKYDLIAGTAAPLAGSPPNADLVATVRDFVVLSGDPGAKLNLSWSGFNNAEQWTPSLNQSDVQPMPDGGEVMGLTGGEYGIILQRNAVKRMTYVGAPIVFQIDTISANIGCMAKGGVAQAGRLVFFLSERGFQMCDGNDVTAIGAEKIDRTFFSTYSRSDIESGLFAAVDPRRNVVMWSMPGSPGRIWCYSWTLQQWSTIDLDLSLVFSGFTANVSVDGLDALYGNLDAVPVSLDDPSLAGGNPLLLIATRAGVVGNLSGPPMAGQLGLARIELADGRARIRTLRPVTDAPQVTATIGAALRADNLPAVETAATMRPNGDLPCRVNAREFTPTLTFAGAWSYATAVDIEYEAAGRR